MNEYKIAVIPGDGIGKEVVREACKVLDRVSNLNNFNLSYEFFDWGVRLLF
ncbi:MAG: isocitrate/isopropylmalate family dehydrogenase [Dehalococcoidia bacterium]